MIKKIFLFLLIAFVLFQFYPRPSKNKAQGPDAQDITRVHQVPDNVAAILKTSCYDCHSNNTNYPWYNHIQPVALWLNNHIEEGKTELNFSEFGSYRLRRQYHKLEEINEQVKEGEMPLSSYTLIHGDAKLSKEQKLAVAQWVESLTDSMERVYPPDSLRRKKS